MNFFSKNVRTFFPVFFQFVHIPHKLLGFYIIFIPIPCGERTVGYVVIRNAVYLMEKQYLFQIMNALTRSMENLHKKEMLAYMNRKLSSLYIMDTLTGMYNRMGYQQLASRVLRMRSTSSREASSDW